MKNLRLQVAGFALLLIPALCSGSSPKLAREFDDIDPLSTATVIVQYARSPSAAQYNRVAQHGGTFRKELNLIQGAVYSVPARAIADLADDPDVSYISPDREVSAALDYSSPTVGADMARQYGWDGTGI